MNRTLKDLNEVVSEEIEERLKDRDRLHNRINTLERKVEKVDLKNRLEHLEKDKVYRCHYCDLWKRGYWIYIGQGISFCSGKCWYEFSSTHGNKKK